MFLAKCFTWCLPSSCQAWCLPGLVPPMLSNPGVGGQQVYLARWHHSRVAVKVLTHSDNSREAEQFRHGEYPNALAQSLEAAN